MRKTSRLLVLVLAVFAALMVAACGGPSQSAGGLKHPAGWGKPAPKSAQLRATATPTATMYDTITLSTVPSRPFALAGYTSGFWPTYLPLRSAYPSAHTISIAVTASHHADCLDVEPGDAVPSQVASWVRADIAAGFKRPCVYSSYWEFVNQVRPDLAAAHISRSAVFEWDADYTFTDHIDSSFDATQYTDKALGRNLDASRVTLAFLSIAQPPYVKPKPKPPTYDQQFNAGFQRGFTVHWDRRHRRRVPPLGRVTITHAWQSGYNAGWRAAR